MIPALGYFTEQEILAQPRVWIEVEQACAQRLAPARDLWRTASPASIVLAGCGSSYYLAHTAACLLEARSRIPCRAFPSSELLLADDISPGGRLLLIAISRSGETTETIRAVERFRQSGAATLALTCTAGGTLTRTCDVSITLPVHERSVVMTASFTSMLLAVALLAPVPLGQGPDVVMRPDQPVASELPALIDQAQTLTNTMPERCVYLGSGPRYGLACEGALKMTEMALVSGCAYHTLEYLHGPMAAATPEMLVIGLLSRRGADYERQVLRRVAHLGAAVVAVGGEVEGLPAVRFAAEIDSVPALLLSGLWLQLLALYAARKRGINPDTPRFLQPVVMWDGMLLRGGGS